MKSLTIMFGFSEKIEIWHLLDGHNHKGLSDIEIRKNRLKDDLFDVDINKRISETDYSEYFKKDEVEPEM